MNGPHEQPADSSLRSRAADDIRALASGDEREAAVLAESWTALGQLLEASTPQLDEAALLRAVEQRLASRRPLETNAIQRAGMSRRTWQYLAGTALGLATAAAIVFAISIRWQPAPVEPQGDAPQLANVEPPAIEPQTKDKVVPAVDVAVTPRDDLELAWEDDFSAQLESAQASVRSIEGSWREGLDATTVVRQRIDEYARELEGAPL